MRAIIVSSFDTYLERIELLKEYYDSKGYNTTVILSNFKHFKKEFVNEEKEGYIYIKTNPYYKNLSLDRLYSHYRFSKDAFIKVEQLQPDLLHVLIPANSLTKDADNYKKRHPNVKLYLDLIDLWPETMPIGNIKNMFPFSLWKKIRDDHLDSANLIFTECNLYKNILTKDNDPRYKTLYWAKKDEAIESFPSIKNNEIHLCYLGSINNIIDIDIILEICNKFQNLYPVYLHIIGNGEKKQELLNKVKSSGINIIDHGTIYDKVSKQKIFDKCHFGLNIMKSSVCVGLTMKSLDYFQAGLPIINNIQGDTWKLVNDYRIGFNYQDGCNILLNINTNKELRENTKKIYNEMFSKASFLQSFRELEEI